MVFRLGFRQWISGKHVFAAAVLSIFLAGGGVVHAQSGTRTPRPAPQGGSQSRNAQASPARQAPQEGSQSRDAQASVGLQGYCPVCVVEMKKWIRGKPEHQVTQDGTTYFFPSDEQKEMFLADPVKYTPAFGGGCTVCSVNMGQRVPGDIRFASLYAGRLFLFPGEAQKQEFHKNPEKYADADLALDGRCSVCRIDMNQEVQGKPEISTVYQGLRYLFPGEKQRKAFLANPSRYAVKPATNTR